MNKIMKNSFVTENEHIETAQPSRFRAFLSRPIGKFLASMFLTWVVMGSISLFLLYGPWSGFRTFMITSTETTINHKYISRIFFSDETIKKVMDSNTVVEFETTVDTNHVNTIVEESTTTLTEISKDGYKAWKLEVSDPSKVQLGISKYFGIKGQKMPYLLQNYPDAIAGINAGGFGDASGWGNGGVVMGYCMAEGEVLNYPKKSIYNIIGFDKNNVLILGNFTRAELEELNLRDAVEFTPFLIINGEAAEIKGNGGWGTAPRTAIGQKKDGTVVFVVVDGRQPGYSMGVTMKQLQEIMVEAGCYNAANLDGGSSTVLSYEDEIINQPSGSDADGMRFIPNAFIVME